MMESWEYSSRNDQETSRSERNGKAPLLGNAIRPESYQKAIGIFHVLLRIGAAAASLASTITMGTTEQTLPFFTQFFQFQASYEDIAAFTFFIIAMSIVTGYLVLSVPFSIACVAMPLATAPRLLLIICDTMSVSLATSAASSSAAIVYLAHTGSSDANWLAICQQFNEFCQRSSGAVVAAFVAVVMIVLMVALSAMALRKH